MNARLPSTTNKAATSGGAPIEGDAHPNRASGPRVVSLSPAAAGIEVKPLPLECATSASAIEMPGSMNHVSEQAHDEIAQRLKELLAALETIEPQARETSMNLHERLRLGARMLQAFAAQINRIESALAGIAARRNELDRSLENARTAHEKVQRQTDQATRLAAERIESAASEAVERVQAAGSHTTIAPMADRLDAVESRLRALEERAGAVANATGAAPAKHEQGEIRREIGELAGAMRQLADRVGRIIREGETTASAPAADHEPLRFQKWAGHG